MKKLLAIVFVTLSSSLVTICRAQLISTVAGNGTASYSGDGGQATLAEINNAQGVAVDASGNIYIADRFNLRVRKVSTSGIISTFAGNGTVGHSGDGGPATSAELWDPVDVTVDSLGNVYITDFDNARIREVNTSGIINTIIGNGIIGYTGDGGPATSAEIRCPGGIAVDPLGNIYFSDECYNCVRKVNSSGIITTVAGIGSLSSGYSGDGGQATDAELYSPTDVAVDASGNLYICDWQNQAIRMVNSSGIINTIAGIPTIGGYSGDGGAATAAEFNQPFGIAIDRSYNIFIADANNNRIRMVNKLGNISTFAGNGTAGFSGDGGTATAAEINSPNNVAISLSHDLYIADVNNSRIRKTAGVAGIDEVANNLKMIIYPNPNNGKFTLEVKREVPMAIGISTKSDVEVYNMLGEKVYSTPFSTFNSQLSIDLPCKSAGVYLYRVISETGAFISEGKFVIER